MQYENQIIMEATFDAANAGEPRTNVDGTIMDEMTSPPPIGLSGKKGVSLADQLLENSSPVQDVMMPSANIHELETQGICSSGLSHPRSQAKIIKSREG